MVLTTNEFTIHEYDCLLRQDFCAFMEQSFLELNAGTEYQHNWHLEVMASELEACRRGETKRLIINLPPRSLKSHTVSVAFPACILGHDPALRSSLRPMARNWPASWRSIAVLL